MEGLHKKTVYLEMLEKLENNNKQLSTDISAGGLKFLLLHLLYEMQHVNAFFADVESTVQRKEYTKDILLIDADVNYIEWSKDTHFKIDIDAQNLPEDEKFEPIEKNIWSMLDSLPPNGSKQYVDFNRTEYKLILQQLLWSKCNNKQLYYALTNSIKQLKETLCRIGMKQEKRELSLEDGEKLYKGEEIRFNFSEATKVVSDFKAWKKEHDDDEETIMKHIVGKMYAEMRAFFDSGFLAPKIRLQSEVDFSIYKEDIDFGRLNKDSNGLNIEAHYSAMRELFNFRKGILIPRKDKIGKYFFKHRKEVTEEHRTALFRFIKMLALIEEEKKPKAKKISTNTEKPQKKEFNEESSIFYQIVQHEEPQKLLKRLHQLIDGRKGADVGCVLLKCVQDGYLTRNPKQKEFESEFILIGGWNAIHNYMSDNNENALERANKIIIF